MKLSTRIIVIGFVALSIPSLLAQSPRPTPSVPASPTIEQFLTPGYPSDLVSARRVDRVAWIAYERGQRNVYSAVAPGFQPVRLTRFLDDNGVELTSLDISDDGSVVTFARGTAPNREGWIANPTSDPAGADRTIWAARTSGGAAWKLGEGTTPVLSPDGRSVAYAKDGQIYRYEVRLKPDATTAGQTTAHSASASTASNASGSTVLKAASGSTASNVASGFSRTSQTPYIKAWGTSSGMKWSPDGTKIAFVSDRGDHSFVGVYDARTRAVMFLSPSVDHDTSPTWSADGKRIAFIRRPGTPFGQQAHQGAGSIGNPNGPAFNPQAVGRGTGRGGNGRGGRGQADEEDSRAAGRPGLYDAKFKGGYTLSFWVADAATGDAHEFWHNPPNDREFSAVNSIQWADADHVVFQAEPAEWSRYYSVSVSSPAAAPVELTPGEGMVENVGLSSDGTYLFYCTNTGDIDRRHIWKVPAKGGASVQITKGDTIETYPAVLASGRHVAVLSADARRPFSVGIVPADGGDEKVIFPSLKDFPSESVVVPQPIVTRAADGQEIHNQLFLPKDLKAGEKRPAVIFVHGGPVRQMLLGGHYMHFYHIAYEVNQWLASRGYVVMSVNYRSGIGYGKSFRTAPNTGGRGNAEYQDVVAGGKYLQSRPDVDPNRVGIWGLSYGGVLTAQALARNSDIFKVGVDLAGVHLWGSSLDPDNVSYLSSAISAIDTWKSPVLLVHGDDDRNVQFSQTTGLVQLLRAHDVYHELIVYPDDTHEPLQHKRYLYAFQRLEEFIGRFLKGEPARTTAGGR